MGTCRCWKCGGRSVVCPTARDAEQVLGQPKAGIRRLYSSPPLHGEQLVATVLHSDSLRRRWEAEVREMRERIQQMRQGLARLLAQRLPGMSTGFLTAQRGMFSYTGLHAAEVDLPRERHGIYMLRSGRMCVAGLNQANLATVADALSAVLRERG
jgi:aromatic-amino-acid transaminase